MCKLFGYTKQAYYKRKTGTKKEASKRALVKSMVMDIRSKLPRLGTRKLYYLLKDEFDLENIKMGRDKLFSLLREEGLLIRKRRKYTKTTNSNHWFKKYKNLTKGIELKRPEQLWVADITYIQTVKEHEYLHLITDAYSKQIMGFELSDNLKALSTIKALKMALGKKQYAHKLIHHSDRCMQYCSYDYIKLLKSNNISISMTEQYDPNENAVAERVNGILKDEFGLDNIFEESKILETELKQAIELYNQYRPYLTVNMLTPNQAHKQQNVKLKKWKKVNHAPRRIKSRFLMV